MARNSCETNTPLMGKAKMNTFRNYTFKSTPPVVPGMSRSSAGNIAGDISMSTEIPFPGVGRLKNCMFVFSASAMWIDHEQHRLPLNLQISSPWCIHATQCIYNQKL